MMITKYLSLLICLAIILSCSEERNIGEKGGVIQLNISESKESSLAEVFERIEYKQLNLPKNLFIPSINKVVQKNGDLYILDRSKSKAIYVVDANGDFKFRIKQTGQGPGEYLSPTDMFVGDNYIEILDVTNKILYFDLSGRFVKEEKLPFNVNKFLKIDEAKYYFYTKESNTRFGENLNCQLIWYDFETKNSQCLLGAPNQKIIYASEDEVIANGSSQVLFTKRFSDTIYLVNQNQAKMRYILDFADNALPKELIDPTQFSYVQIIETLNNTTKEYHSPGLFANNDFLVTRYHSGKPFFLFFDKTNLSLKSIPFGQENDIDNGWSFYGFDFINDDYCGELVFPDFLIERYDKLKAEDSNSVNESSFTKFVSNIDPDGSMVLIKYHFKKQE